MLLEKMENDVASGKGDALRRGALSFWLLRLDG